MIRQKFSGSPDRILAENCRRALEKSYGIDIPLPKCLVEKETAQNEVFRGEKMFKNRLLETLRHSKNGEKPDDETVRAMAKIENHKRLSSQEFLKIYDTIWQEGPKTEYRNPDNWRRSGDV